MAILEINLKQPALLADQARSESGESDGERIEVETGTSSDGGRSALGALFLAVVTVVAVRRLRAWRKRRREAQAEAEREAERESESGGRGRWLIGLAGVALVVLGGRRLRGRTDD